MSVNEVRIDGRIGKDAEIRFTASGACVVKFSIANTERKKQGDEWVDGDTGWYDVEYWPKDPEEARRFVKGAYLCLKGRLKVDKWESQGTKHQKVKIAMREVESWEFVKGGQSQGHQAPRGPLQAPVRTAPANDPNAYIDDVPF